MKILESEVNFTQEINPGRYAYFIKIDEHGIERDINELVEQISFFNRIILYGNPFGQKQDVALLIKKVIKKNPNCIVEIISDGTITPIGLGTLDTIIYTVELKLKNSGIDYKNRINPTVINWFIQSNATFRFDVKSIDDINEVELLMQDFGIKKSNIFLSLTNLFDMKKLIMYCKTNGLNISINLYVVFGILSKIQNLDDFERLIGAKDCII